MLMNKVLEACLLSFPGMMMVEVASAAAEEETIYEVVT